MSTTKILYDGSLFASHYQFWVYDDALDRDDLLLDRLEEISDAMSKSLTQLGYFQLQSFVAIRTRAHTWHHWLELLMAERVPRFKERHESKRVASIALKSNRVNIEAPTDAEPQATVRIPRGKYRLYVFGYNLGVEANASESEQLLHDVTAPHRSFEGYRLVFVPKRPSRQPGPADRGAV